MKRYPLVPSSKYCYTCGAHLLESTYVWSYDCNTGTEQTAKEYHCLNKKWWNVHPATETDAYVYWG